jgi:nitroreductase
MVLSILTQIGTRLKQILPASLVSLIRTIYIHLKRRRRHLILSRMFRKDLVRYLKYSRTSGNDDPVKMTGTIILQYHVIEKGLTMPEVRPGFGQDRIISLCGDCRKYIEKYGMNDQQILHAAGVIFEYENYHRQINFILEKNVRDSISGLKNILQGEPVTASQRHTSKTDYFRYVSGAFREFSESRASVRHFTDEDIPSNKIRMALDLARNTPSACNRQSWRTYVFTEKKIISGLLESQGGNRGFGHLTNKLIIIAGELGVFCNSNERNQVYIDGGIYAMNLLYSLHSMEIAACIMNCSFDHEKEEEIKVSAGIKESEVLIAMIACGIPPDEFKIASSPRYDIDKTNKFIN